MLLALATPKLCDLFSLALVSPLPLWREGKPAVGAIPTAPGQYSTHILQLWSQHSVTHQPHSLLSTPSFLGPLTLLLNILSVEAKSMVLEQWELPGCDSFRRAESHH